MIPRIQTGTSFAGAGLYYLHDKMQEDEKERLTTDRVAWTYAINTLEEEPEAVLAEMRQTAFDQPLLKQLSGNRLDGRPTERTVMTVALAWSPEQSPDKQHMIETGHSFLQHMGWEAHQVLFVGHRDTKHPHFHMIINRVHPETGMTLDDTWSQTRAQRWALAYEREQGQIYCHGREAKYGKSQARDAPHMNYREWKAWQEIAKENAFEAEFQRALQAGEWDALKEGQKQERIGFWNETGQLRHELRTAVREAVKWEFAKEWQDYAKSKEERDRAAVLYDREARGAIRELRKQRGPRPAPRNAKSKEIAVVRGPDGRTYIKRRTVESQGIEQIKERKRAYHTRQREELWEVRKDIYARQKARFEELATPALAMLSKGRAEAYENIRAAHRGEKAELRRDQQHGDRRQDVLGGYSPAEPQPTPLTKEQRDAYIAHALRVASRQQQFDGAGREIADADRGRAQEPVRDPHEAQRAKEATDRNMEKRDKDQARQDEGQRRANVDWYIKKRERDRARERGDGGRER
jgi:hypothetical protein